ncbi:MAG TPA: hypothetical protein VNY07_11200 [Chthoniobacterales bacterium]|nr:hypothetical protein [Chthoniobacterales bacterium]
MVSKFTRLILMLAATRAKRELGLLAQFRLFRTLQTGRWPLETAQINWRFFDLTDYNNYDNYEQSGQTLTVHIYA